MAKKVLKTAEKASVELTLFNVGDILCGVNTSHVREINKHLDITNVPGAPEYVRGVVNLRGQVVTIIDLRKKFGMKSLSINDKMGIVVISSEVRTSVFWSMRLKMLLSLIPKIWSLLPPISARLPECFSAVSTKWKKNWLPC